MIARLIPLLLACALAFPGLADEVESASELEIGITAYRNKDYQVTIEGVLPLAIQGNAEAQYLISRMYLFGQGFPEDQCASAIWAEKAARQGHPYAAVAMSFSFQSGGGIKSDEEMAYRWMAYANKQGHPDVHDELDFLARFITPGTRAKIDEDIKTWDPSKLPAPEFFPVSGKVLQNAMFRNQLSNLGVTGCTIQ